MASRNLRRRYSTRAPGSSSWGLDEIGARTPSRSCERACERAEPDVYRQIEMICARMGIFPARSLIEQQQLRTGLQRRIVSASSRCRAWLLDEEVLRAASASADHPVACRGKTTWESRRGSPIEIFGGRGRIDQG